MNQSISDFYKNVCSQKPHVTLLSHIGPPKRTVLIVNILSPNNELQFLSLE
jgi:hypothetical protein